MPHTLVTGANSFVAAHIINELISQGHAVTGSIRRSSSGDEILAEHPEWKSHLDFVEIADYAEPGAWDKIFREHDFDFVVHVAAPVLDESLTDYDRDYLRPSVEGYV
jgi:nucleoside-diphosphate-sugar epimerase